MIFQHVLQPQVLIQLQFVIILSGAYREHGVNFVDSVKKLLYTNRTCRNVIAGAVKRNGHSGCKCPHGSIIRGPAPACQEVSGMRYFTLDQLEPEKCHCEQEVKHGCSEVISGVGCRYAHCDAWRNATCKEGTCRCDLGFCAISGVCVREAKFLSQPTQGPLPFKLTVNRAHVHREISKLLPTEPYVKGRLGTKRFKSPISELGGQEPVWRYQYHFLWEGEPFLNLKVVERHQLKDLIIGSGVLDVTKAYKERTETAIHIINLTYKGTPVGKLSIAMQWENYVLFMEQRHCQAKNQTMRIAHSVKECAEQVWQSGGRFFATAQVYDNNTETYPCFKVETTAPDCEGNWVPGKFDFYTLDIKDLRTYDNTCKRDTSATCALALSGCSKHRLGEAVCTDRKCMCKQGFCFKDGKCIADCETKPSHEISDSEKAYVELNLKSLEHATLKDRAHALEQLGRLGDAASPYADDVAQYVDHGFLIRVHAHWKQWFGYQPNDHIRMYSQYTVSGLVGNVARFITRASVGGMILQSTLWGSIEPRGVLGTVMSSAFGQLSNMILPKKISARAHANAAIRANATKALSLMGKCGQRYAGHIALRLADPFSSVRMEALSALQRMPAVGADYAGEIALLLNDPEYSIRNKAREVIAALGEGASAGAADDLVALLVSDKPLVQTLAIRSLGMLGTSAGKHVSKVAEFLGSTEPNLKQAAAQTLSLLGPAVAAVNESLIRVLRDEHADELVRGFVAVALYANELYLSEVERCFPDGHGLPPVVLATTSATALQRYLQESHARILAEQKQHQAELALIAAKKRIHQLQMNIEINKNVSQVHEGSRSLALIGSHPLFCMTALLILTASSP